MENPDSSIEYYGLCKRKWDIPISDTLDDVRMFEKIDAAYGRINQDLLKTRMANEKIEVDHEIFARLWAISLSGTDNILTAYKYLRQPHLNLNIRPELFYGVRHGEVNGEFEKKNTPHNMIGFTQPDSYVFFDAARPNQRPDGTILPRVSVISESMFNLAFGYNSRPENKAAKLVPIRDVATGEVSLFGINTPEAEYTSEDLVDPAVGGPIRRALNTPKTPSVSGPVGR